MQSFKIIIECQHISVTVMSEKENLAQTLPIRECLSEKLAVKMRAE